MVEDRATATLDRTFAALADPTRRAILDRLAGGENTVTTLAEPFEMSMQAVSKHLNVLEGAGLISRTRDGRLKRCRLDASPLRDAAEWVDGYRRFWTDRLGALESYLDSEA